MDKEQNYDFSLSQSILHIYLNITTTKKKLTGKFRLSADCEIGGLDQICMGEMQNKKNELPSRQKRLEYFYH